ncbi:MAG: alanine--tRNA ligase [Chloroflexi bacterium]|nr:alanine--tRNA ligase [Chloroflexota bacterium]
MHSLNIRQSFIEFFASKGHTLVPSSSLIPQEDPTLLFTNAGMVQFKDVFLGREQRPYTSAVTVQKCVRAGGKHNDLDNVGRTARHHTFFEMLGNFSFGRYFKEEAITLAWEYLTQVLSVPPERLWATVFEQDDESFHLWEKIAGLKTDRIVPLREKDNFWSMGETGPCGPCTEILIDRGEKYRCHAPVCAIGRCDCDRYFELWNLVFMQFQREPTGKLVPLPTPCVDTGMGLERMASILQGVNSNFDTDLFRPLITCIEEISGKSYSDGDGFAFRVIADHVRACTFLIADGAVPSNEGRGYVLRRIMRRAIQYGRKLGLDKPFLDTVAQKVIDQMGGVYAELIRHRDTITRVMGWEESRFRQTLSAGMNTLEQIIQRALKEGRRTISGQEAFQLYDTYGFPREMTAEAAAECNMSIDWEGFEASLAVQRERARASSRFGLKESTEVYRHLDLPETRFVGQEELSQQSALIGIMAAGASVERIEEGQDGEVVALETPFYPEGGGQVGDKGEIRGATGRFVVEDTQRPLADLIVHRGRVVQGFLSLGDPVELEVDGGHRRETARHHTATHLLHAALRQVLGPHVRQSGSWVGPQRLRFDFSHLSAVTQEELEQAQHIVNDWVRQNLLVIAENSTFQEAIDRGALAFFEEKYGENVRVISITSPRGDSYHSKELCGGTHVSRTGEIGLFLIIDETSIGAGLRRVEALASEAATRRAEENLRILERLSARLGAALPDIEAKVEALTTELEKAAKEGERLRRQIAQIMTSQLLDQAMEVDHSKIIVTSVSDPSMLSYVQNYLQEMVSSGICILAAAEEKSVTISGIVTPDLVEKGLNATELVTVLAKMVDGGGGGRPDWAQGGGKSPTKLPNALQRQRQELVDKLKEALKR